MTSDPVREVIRIDAVFADGFMRTGMAEHTWNIEDPLSVQVKFTIAINSTPITRDEYPFKPPACSRCQETLRYGTYGVIEPTDKDNPLRCVNCAHTDAALVTDEETWSVGLQLYVDALLDRADRDHTAVADVQLTRPSKRFILMTLRDDDGWMKVSVPIEILKRFLSAVNEARRTLGPSLDQNYTETGISALENLANGVS